MEHNQIFSLALAAATASLTACGGSDSVTSTSAPITPATVACEPPARNELRDFLFVSACVPDQATGRSSRYDLSNDGSTLTTLNKIDFSDSSCTTGATLGASLALDSSVGSENTTTIGRFAADGVTPVTGSGREITFRYRAMYDTDEELATALAPFPRNFPFFPASRFAAATYVVCKTTPPSTTTARVLQYPGGSTRTFTPDFALRTSAAGTTTINLAFGLDGVSKPVVPEE
jgi:hypothetical protein